MTTSTARPIAERHMSEWAWLIIAIGIVVRLQGLDWDLGNLFNPDEANIAHGAAPLTWAHWVPTFYAYNGLTLYLPRLLAEVLAPLTGRAGSELDAIIFAGRLLSAVYASLALPLLWVMARRIFAPLPALFVLICAAASPGLIQTAHFATTEAALILCLLLVLWLALRHMQGRQSLTSFALWTGVVIGVGFGFKTTALAFAVIPAVAVLQSTLLVGWQWRRTALAALLGVLPVVIIGLITTPQIWAASADFFATMAFESGVVAGTADVYWTYQFTGAPPVLFELSQLPWLMGPLAAPLGLAGFAVVLLDIGRRRPLALLLAPAAAFGLIYAIIIFGWHAKFIRYLVLLIPILLLAGGYLLDRLDARFWQRAIAIAAIATTLVAGLLQAAIYQMPDPRIAAWDWLAPQLQGRERVLVEPVEVGPAYGGGLAEVVALPLIEPSGPGKLETIAEDLSSARWMVIFSRRHHDVLPRLRGRFPEMCGYYAALWSGELGFQPIGAFGRRPAFLEALMPERWAEETFTVFDSPQVIVLAKTVFKTPDELLAAMRDVPAQCR